MPLATRRKLLVAPGPRFCERVAQRLFGTRYNEVTVVRDGLRCRLNVPEGIDLATYFGAFERWAVNAHKRLIRPSDIVSDMGADIGVHTLRLALLRRRRTRVRDRTAFAFEK